MRILKWVVILVGRLNTVVGHAFSWLALAAVLVCFAVVLQRYLFNSTHLWMQDLYVWLNGFMFTAVAAYALFRDDHVRVDIFYRPATLRRKAWVDLLGVLVFLMPYCAVVWIYSEPYVTRSWRLQEASGNIGGMPGLFILKSFILVFLVLIALQGLAMIARSILVLRGLHDQLPEPYRYKTGT